MPRPTNKIQLIDDIQTEHAALETLLNSLSHEQMTAPNVVGAWSVKDVLAHLTAWEQMCLAWYQAGKRGETPKTPAEDLSWRQIPELNLRIYNAHQHQPLAVVLEAFGDSYAGMLDAVQQMTEQELFAPNYYAWTRTTTLGSYVTSATCSHYGWARKEIRKGLKGK